MKKIVLVAGLLLSAFVLFWAIGCSGGGGGGSDDDGVSYSSGSGSGSSSGGSGTSTYTSVAGGTFKWTSPLARSWQSRVRGFGIAQRYAVGHVQLRCKQPGGEW